MSPAAKIAFGFGAACVIAVAALAIWLYRGGHIVSIATADPPESKAEATAPNEEATVSHAQEAKPAHTNRLINETSPYLLQHAHNPVDWYPWGDEALAKAKEEDKPIFLSVGYSACHWCHVMEDECFENEDVAAIMNEHFINIKVDREERPDIDEIYMAAVQAMTGSGGWPMSVFLTPDLEPFYGGTYFPPEDKFGRPGFKSVLRHIAKIWNEDRQKAVDSAGRLTDHMKDILSGRIGEPSSVTETLLTNAVNQLRQGFDKYDGGFGSAPKFPSSASISLLFRAHSRSGDDELLTMARLTLDKMAQGGIYDHLGGGFARYSTDAEWLVPHFEKMLYDNAQLAEAYLEAYQVTGAARYRRTVEETFGYILRDMRDEQGGFYSAEDADSEGQEGKFYIWKYDEIIDALGEEDGKLFAEYYGVLKRGNFNSHEPYHKGENILHMRGTHEAIAAEMGENPEELREKIDKLRGRLLEVRSQRVRPGLDDKILTSWNALMISAFAKGYRVLGDEAYLDAALGSARFVLDEMTDAGELLRTHRAGESRIPGYLDDYAFMADACIDLYEATFDPAWLAEADRLTRTMIEKFWDADEGGFFMTSEDHKNLIVRARPTFDGSVPSGNSTAAFALLRLAKFLDQEDYYAKAKTLLEGNHTYLTKAPQGFMKMILAVDFFLHPPKEIALAGDLESEGNGIAPFLDALYGHYVPNKVVAAVDPDAEDAGELGRRIPLLAGKSLVNGQAAGYVCKDYTCQLPVTTTDAFLAQLGVKGDE